MRLTPALASLASLASLAALVASSTGLSFAQESFVVGPRALGMGGTGVAAVDDVPAQYYNPAAFGFFAYQPPAAEQTDKGPDSVDNNNLWEKSWGVGIDATFGARIHQDFADHIDVLKKYYDDGTLDRLSAAGLAGSQADALALMDMLNALGNLSDTDNAITADANAGLAMRIGHFGLGVRNFSQISGRVQNVDLVNLGLGGIGDLNTQLSGITPSGSGSVLSAAQIAQLDTNTNLSNANITTIDQLAAQAGVTPEQTQLLVDSLVAAANGSGGALNTNTSAARMYGVSLIEIPLSYGWAFNENISVGGNVKAMIGRVYGTDVLVFGDDIAGAIERADENYEQTVTWGIDLAVMFRLPMLNLGLTTRNLNSPTFDGPTVGLITYEDYEIEPSATLGAAFIPAEWFTLAVDVDLTSNSTVLSDYDTQMLRFGGELNIYHFIALRGGYSYNLAEDDIGGLVHAGLGIDFWIMRIDLAGAMALETTTYDGNTVPREARVGLQLAADF
jgi:ATP-dependent protease HslVU (ClpYQ) peptidase subunit